MPREGNVDSSAKGGECRLFRQPDSIAWSLAIPSLHLPATGPLEACLWDVLAEAVFALWKQFPGLELFLFAGVVLWRGALGRVKKKWQIEWLRGDSNKGSNDTDHQEKVKNAVTFDVSRSLRSSFCCTACFSGMLPCCPLPFNV